MSFFNLLYALLLIVSYFFSDISVLFGQLEENGSKENAEKIPRRQPAHPRVANEVQIEKIISDINTRGPLTRSKASHLSNFCGHFTFVSITEPTKVDEAFLEPEWIQAMQEELHQFKLNNVWELVKRPHPCKHNIISAKWPQQAR